MEKSNFYIHFDLDGGKHSIPIHQSIITEQAVEIIINNISSVIFEGNVKVKILIDPPENGGHVFKIVIGTVLLGTYAFANTNFGSGFIEGLTGKNTSDYGKEIGLAVNNIIKDGTIRFLSESSHDLVESGVCIDKFYSSYEVKNNFYKSAIANNSILGLGFCKDHTFPIDKNSFYYKTIELKKEKTSNKYIDKYHDLLVISPINSEEDKHLKWQVKDKKLDEKFGVNITDDDFYKIYFQNNLLIREFKVRVRYYISVDNFGEEKIEKKEVVMVYEYNNNVKLMTLSEKITFDLAPYKLPEKYNEVENQTNLNI